MFVHFAAAIALTAVLGDQTPADGAAQSPIRPAVEEQTAPPDKPAPPPPRGLIQLPVEVPPERLKASICTAEDWKRIHSLRRRSLVSFYVVGPAVAMVVSAYRYKTDHRLTPRDYGLSLGAGIVVGVGFGGPNLSAANRRLLECTFPR